MNINVRIVNAFVDGDCGGNPAGVIMGADGLSTAEKLSIASKVGLSETAFVSSSKHAAFKLEFFTPTRQIAHCGHATVAAFALLRQLGRVGEGWTSKETTDGNREILIKGDMAFMEQRKPEYRRLDDDPLLLKAIMVALGIKSYQFADGLWPTQVTTGGEFLILPLIDQAQVAGLKPNREALARLSEYLDLIGFYAFSPDTLGPQRAAGARMFAPYYGITEEAATGMAAGALACFLHDYMGVPGERLLIEQGYLMHPPSPSVIAVDLQLDGQRIERLMVGGRTQMMGELNLQL